MFDIGWMEMVVIGTVALVVVGPKDLPGLFRSTGQFMAKARGMARDFQRSMEQAANEAGLGEASKVMSALNKVGLDGATNSARDFAKSMALGDAKPKVTTTPPASAVATPVAADVAKPAVRRKPVTRAKPAAAAKTARAPAKKAAKE